MKQYTTPEQTAKLIELGLEKPKNRLVKQRFDRSTSSWIVVGEEGNYSIGELIEILPKTIIHEIWWGEEKGMEGVWGLCIDTEATDYGWDVTYTRNSSAYLYRVGRTELIDALYNMVVKLKEEGVIWQ